MKRIAFFCIPAHGHTNPMLPVAQALVQRGNQVRFYSFEMFREKIEKTGAAFVSCDGFLPELNAEQEKRLKKISTTEMSLQDFRITCNMTEFLEREMKIFRPDVIYTDSVCFWGKLTAQKYDIPMVVSTSTFAFNQLSSKYLKSSPTEMADRIFGLPKLNAELKKMAAYGYRTKSALSLVMSDNRTDSIVYTSEHFQPYGHLFSKHYAFVGPSVFSTAQPNKVKERPLVYISMGTVINERPTFYQTCMQALGDGDWDVVISCGKNTDPKTLEPVPQNVKIYPYVDQLDVLSKADVFITHCGMNSVSESLYMATPMVLYPQTSEQGAVARRAAEIGAGVLLENDSASGIREAVETVLKEKAYAAAAAACSRAFRACGGPAQAAEFIENAPHSFANETDPLKELNRKAVPFQVLYWSIMIALMVLLGCLGGSKYVWIIGVVGGILNGVYSQHLLVRLASKKQDKPSR